MCPVQYNKMAAKAKVRLKVLDVFEDLNNFVDVNGSIYMLVGWLVLGLTAL